MDALPEQEQLARWCEAVAQTDEAWHASDGHAEGKESCGCAESIATLRRIATLLRAGAGRPLALSDEERDTLRALLKSVEHVATFRVEVEESDLVCRVLHQVAGNAVDADENQA